MFKKYYAYEVVTGINNEFFASGVVSVWFFQSAKVAYGKVVEFRLKKNTTDDFTIINLRRIN